MKNIKISVKLLVLASLTFPAIALAQNLIVVLDVIINLIRLLIPIVVSLALLYFFWGLAQFISKSGGEAGIEEGKRKMIWGIIALFVMLSVWGIISLISNTFLGGSNFGAFDLNVLIPDI